MRRCINCRLRNIRVCSKGQYIVEEEGGLVCPIEISVWQF